MSAVRGRLPGRELRLRFPGCLLLTAALAAAQDTTFRSSVPLVVAPVSVTDRDHKPIDGLSGGDFQLLVDGKPRPFDDDGAIPPIALVIAIQTGNEASAALTKIGKTGSMIDPLITGRRGRAAVLAFDRELDLLQGFTNDPYAIVSAFSRLSHAGSGTRLVDAVDRAVRMLVEGPRDSRRVILLIAASRDGGSESKLEEVVTRAQLNNVSIYTLTWSAVLSAFAAAPGTTTPSSGMNLGALFAKIRDQGKQNAAEALSNYTGGRRFSFVKQGALEDAIAAIGEELHSQYLLSFTPPAGEDQGFHSIRVGVPSRPEALVRTRPGYWIGDR